MDSSYSLPLYKMKAKLSQMQITLYLLTVELLLSVIYADDILLTSNDLKEIQYLKTCLLK